MRAKHGKAQRSGKGLSVHCIDERRSWWPRLPLILATERNGKAVNSGFLPNPTHQSQCGTVFRQPPLEDNTGAVGTSRVQRMVDGRHPEFVHFRSSSRTGLRGSMFRKIPFLTVCSRYCRRIQRLRRGVSWPRLTREAKSLGPKLNAGHHRRSIRLEDFAALGANRRHRLVRVIASNCPRPITADFPVTLDVRSLNRVQPQVTEQYRQRLPRWFGGGNLYC